MRVALILFAALSALGANNDDLHNAVHAGDLERVRALLKQGVPVNAVDSRGGTALHDAVWAGDKNIVALLVEAGADVNARHAEAGSTPLHYAIITNRVDASQILIAKGADGNARYKGGATPLHGVCHLRFQQCPALDDLQSSPTSIQRL